MNHRGKIIGMATIAIIVTLAILASSLSASAANMAPRGQSTSGVIASDVRIIPKIISITTATNYEQLTAFGLNPQSRELAATVNIKQTSGYNNFEYVSIWVDWNDNGAYESNELAGISEVYATNSPSGTYLPFTYTVHIKANPPPGVTTAFFKDRKARAILSFSTPATNPNFVPSFGNVLNGVVKLDAIN